MELPTLGCVTLLLVVWAIIASNRMSRKARQDSLEAAKTPTNTVGHAKYGNAESLTDKQGGLRLMFDKVTGDLLRIVSKDGQHGVVSGHTGSGKTSWLISAILDIAGRASMIYVDSKGSITAVCAEYLASKGKLIVCNPYENQEGLFPMVLPRSTPFNPLAGLTPAKHGFTAECKRIASTFPDQRLSANENSAHFKERAVGVIAGVIMHVCDRFPPDQRNLTTCRNVITSSNGENFWEFVLDVIENGTLYAKQLLASYGEINEEGRLVARGTREVMDVLATAARYTDWLGNEDIGPSLEGDGLRYASLKDEAQAVALICPLQYLHTDGGKWLKLHMTSAIHQLWRNGRGTKPVYLFMDESDTYADPIIPAALNTARQFGIHLIVIVQQWSDIDARYGKSGQAGAFQNGTTWKLFFASDDERTRSICERLSGTKAVMVPSVSLPDDAHGNGKLSFGEQGLPLKPGYELGELAADECILHVRGIGMLECKKKNYWEDETLKGKWKQDPYEV